jgi:hypothetical protein
VTKIERGESLTWEKVASELEQIGFAVGMLDPRGEDQSGLEALMYKLAAGIRAREKNDNNESS